MTIRPAPTILIAAVGAAALALAAVSRPSRASMTAMEKSLDKRIQTYSLDEPLVLLGHTRGLYLEGYGAIFSAEVNLIPVPASPFIVTRTPQQIAKVRERKLRRVPEVKALMKDVLADFGASLDGVPPEERIVLGLSLFHFSWEDTRELPAQIVMGARRKVLVDFKSGRLNAAALGQEIQITEQ